MRRALSLARRFALPAACAVGLVAAAAAGRQGREAAQVTVQLLAINDLHGHLEPPSGSNGLIGGRPAGGAAYLATHLKNAVARFPDSIIVGAGDLVGASPLLSALFHDEPTIESLNAMNLAVSAVGNHEFDEGWEELLRMQRGGCHPADGCFDGDGFAGASFQYLGANVQRIDGDGSAPLLPATAVRTIAGVRIGFIGATLDGTPRIVAPSAIRGLSFGDEARAANAHAAALKEQGVNAIVLLIHEGGEQSPDGAGPNGCAGFSGNLLPVVERLSTDIKVVISGHTHQFYNCSIAGRHVTSASSFGRMFTRVLLTIDASNGTIAGVSARNEIVTRDVERDPVQMRIVARYGARSAPIANRIVGSIAADITRAANRAGESALGDVIADAQLAATSPPDRGGAVVAFMNAGGIRADLRSADRSGGEPSGQVTYGELFEVQPFGNALTVVTLTGDMVRRLLELQFRGAAGDRPTRLLQVSHGFTYRYRLNAPVGSHIEPGSIRLNGRAIAPDERVRVAIVDYLAAGGDGFSVFLEGTNPVGGALDVDALADYFRASSPVTPGPRNRIVRTD